MIKTDTEQITALGPLRRFFIVTDPLPTKIFQVGSEESLYCGLDQGEGEVLYFCEHLSDVQNFCTIFNHTPEARVSWYVGPKPHSGFEKE